MAHDLIVIGGGIVGASLAYHAVGAGARVLLCDARDPGRATDAGAGIVSHETNTRDASPWRALARRAAEEYPKLAATLAAEQTGDPGYARVGMLVVAVDPDEAKLFDRYQSRLREHGEGGSLLELSPAEAREHFPALDVVARALFDPGAARVDGRSFESALLAAARARGLETSRTRVERLVVEDGQVSRVETEHGVQSAAAIAICGGAWSARFGAQLGVELAVEPQRGQIAHLALRDTDTSGWSLLAGLHDHYMVPWPGGRIAVGATREDGSGFDARTTAAGVRQVLDQALRVAPGLADATLAEVRVGLRPRTPDLLPLLGQIPGLRNAWVATGHGPTGLTLGPLSGRLLAARIGGEDPGVDLTPFRPDRPFAP
jgi:D-amino-acid dehydrogenase